MQANKFFKELLILVISIVPLIYYISIWNSLPDRIPVHFDAQGNPNNYGSRYYLAYTLLFLNVGVYLFLLIIPNIDSKNNFHIFRSTFYKLRVIFSVFFSTISFMIISSAQSGKVSVSLMFIIIATLISILGNYISTIRPNYFIGIRNPWTLENEYIWKKTHKFTSRLWFYAGLLLILIMIILPSAGYKIYIFIGFIIFIAVIPNIYSYLIYNKTLKITNPTIIPENSPDDKNLDTDGWYFGIIYANPKDPKIIVPKRYGIGWTLNFGNKSVILLIVIFILVLITIKHFS